MLVCGVFLKLVALSGYRLLTEIFDVTTNFVLIEMIFVECPVAGEPHAFESLAQLMADSEGELSWPEYLKARVMSNITQSSIRDRLEFIQHSLLIRLRRHGNPMLFRFYRS